MSFISYAQNLEDIVLWKALKHVDRGFYVDVGANDPQLDSVTKAFYDRNWSGINIEPISSHYKGLLKDRPRDINLNCAVSDHESNLKIWECDVRGWATLDESVAASHEANGIIGTWQSVEVTTLEKIFDAISASEIHFLKVDVEGLELEVLKGNNWIKYRPWIVVVEATVPNSQIESHADIESFLSEIDYNFAYADGLNRFYVSNEHEELLVALRYPPNVFDDYQRITEAQAIRDVEIIKSEFDTYRKKVKTADKVKQKAVRREMLEQSLLIEKLFHTINDNNEKQALFLEDIATKLRPLESIRDLEALVKSYAELNSEVNRVHIAYEELLQINKTNSDFIKILQGNIAELSAENARIMENSTWRFFKPFRVFKKFSDSQYFNVTSNFGIRGKIKDHTRAYLRNSPKLKANGAKIARKIGLYNVLRPLYVRLIVAAPPSLSFQREYNNVNSEISFLEINESEKLTVEQIYDRIMRI